MSIPFTTADLIAAVNKRRPVKTPIKDRHFSKTALLSSDTAQIDVKTSPEGIAVAIARGSKSKRTGKDGWESKTVQVPHFSEHDLIKASDLIGKRAFGKTTRELQASRVAEKLDTLRAKFDRTIEFMCIRAMQGDIVDGAGNVIASFGIAPPTALTVSDGTDSPQDAFDDASIAISRALGGAPGNLVAYCGVNAYKALRQNPDVKQLLAGPQGPQMLESGEVSRVSGVQINRLPAVFVDNQGATVPFLGDNEVIVTSDELGGEMAYGPAETPEGPLMTKWFADAWAERDPAGWMVRVETNPLPIVTRPEAVVRYTFS